MPPVDFVIAKTIDGMIVDHPDGLHVGIHNGGAQEFESSFLQVEGQFLGGGGDRWDVLHRPPTVDQRVSLDKIPHIFGKRPKFVLHFQKTLGVVDRGLDLGAIADDARILQQPLHPPAIKSGHFGGIKTGKSLAVMFPFIENRPPAQTRLGGFEDQKLKKF